MDKKLKKNIKFSNKYKHIGYSWVGVPKGWEEIVKKGIIEIEKEMWFNYIPLFLKRWIHYLATGNSIIRVKNRFFYKIRQKLTKGQIVNDIKEKYATLRIYGYFGENIYKIIHKLEKECSKTCQQCSSKKGVKLYTDGWYYNLCNKCKKQYLYLL